MARRPDGNREFARVLHLCLSYTLPQVTAALDLAAAGDSYSADAVRHLLEWAEAPAPTRAPLDPAPYAAYQQRQAHPNLGRYSRLLQAQREEHA